MFVCECAVCAEISYAVRREHGDSLLAVYKRHSQHSAIYFLRTYIQWRWTQRGRDTVTQSTHSHTKSRVVCDIKWEIRTSHKLTPFFSQTPPAFFKSAQERWEKRERKKKSSMNQFQKLCTGRWMCVCVNIFNWPPVHAKPRVPISKSRYVNM